MFSSLACSLLAVLITDINGLYFPENTYSFIIPTFAKPATDIGRVFAVNNWTSKCSTSNIRYDTQWPAEASQFLTIDEKSGILSLSGDDPPEDQDIVHFNVSASCGDSQVETSQVPVQVQWKANAPVTFAGLEGNDDLEKLCWRKTNPKFYLEENIDQVPFAALRDIYAVIPDVSVSYDVSSDNIGINKTSSEITLVKTLDRERSESITVDVTCKLSPGNKTFHTPLIIQVQDVDDNPPLFHNDTQLLERKVTENMKKITSLLTDYDVSTSADQYELKVINDPLNLVGDPTIKVLNTRNRLSVYIVIEFYVKLPKDRTSYTADVHIRDKEYQSLDTQSNLTDTAILRVFISGKLPAVSVEVNRKATNFSRVVALSATTGLKNKTIVQYDMVEGNTSPFRVTPTTGIVYVWNARQLDTRREDRFTFTVLGRQQDDTLLDINIEVYLTGSVGLHSPDCNKWCSQYMNQSTCASGCGIGTSTGLCTWRPGVKKMSSNYKTCTIKRTTCPDKVCDELEALKEHICPQDCTTKQIFGQGQLNSTSGKGISMAKGPCWCDGQPLQCKCAPDDDDILKLRTTTQCPTSSCTSTAPRVAGTVSEQRSAETGSCDQKCKTAITASVVCILAAFIVGIVVIMIWRRRKFRRSQVLKHVGSLVSMTALPSDYQEDRETRTSYHTNPSPQWSPKITMPTYRNDVHVDKWEFPREHLHLEHTLGEGEFGQVVQAQAWGIQGDDRYATVAVKMLKPDATGSEYQDLWSELNLLKEVNHPSVIRLLGACTHNGPFYVIVEYCKHGSLKNFLRSARYKDRKSWDEKQEVDTGRQSNRDSTVTLTMKDLLSFTWQVAKGMEYLSNMKFVHRDLAARNVLVADGRVLKISDFGLSRDVYEADAYLKMTKGRIPVKWMAPESLYAQIYTSKSDIWSFGILLWEIITLGASPYPGIAPERLFSLLRTGYRMDRPEDCPEEVYAIMQKCWKCEPEERPSFNKLADILDIMLQQREGYLELSGDKVYLDGKLNYLDSNEWRGEWCDCEDGYGSITVLHHTGDNYLTASTGLEYQLEEGERGKLLPPSPKIKDTFKKKDQTTKTTSKNLEEDVCLLKQKSIGDFDKRAHWHDNAYEVPCV